jgi:hypothetical protein
VESGASLAGECCTCDVRVAEGRYHVFEDSASDTLVLRERVSVYGGYPQGFGQPRDPRRHRTILDGQEAGDGPGHVYHVVTGADDAVLDGFVITGGRARADQNAFNPQNYGGGLIALSTSPTVTACVFEANEAVYGGGVYATQSTAIFSECRFVDNVADETGGGLHAHSSELVVSRCELRSNHAGRGAGIYCGPGGDLRVQNTTFWSNTAAAEGGGVYVDFASPMLASNSFHANQASAGGALYASGAAHPVVTNSVLWGDAPDEIGHDATSSVAATYCDVQGGCTVAEGCTTDETGNLDVNPHFLDGQNGDLRLWVTSPVVDMGDNSAAGGLTMDQGGDTRILDGDDDSQAVVDLGADELAWSFETMPVVYVDKEAAGANDGTTWTDAYVELRTALGATPPFHQIWVASSTYTPSGLGDREASFQIPAGVVVYGGFDPSQGIIQMALRDPVTYETVLSGDIMEDDHLGNTMNNSRHVVKSGHCGVIDGFTVTRGMGGMGGGSYGGCLQVSEGHLFAARGCRFTECTANLGGAVWAGAESVLILDACTLSDNSAMMGGGGAVGMSDPAEGTHIKDSTFESNSAASGGGLHMSGGQGVTIEGCAFLNNSASSPHHGGGGISANNVADLLITGCTVSGNTARLGGGATLDGCTEAVVEDSTLNANQASDGQNTSYCDENVQFLRGVGGGLFIDEGDVRISGATFADNSAVQDGVCSCNHRDYKYFLGAGGGVFARNAAVDIVDSTFSGNAAQHPGTGCFAGTGGGLASYGTTVRMVNSRFWSNATSVGLNALNICTAGGGGGLWIYSSPEAQLANCAFAGNTATDGGSGLFFAESTAHLYGVTATANSGSYYGSGAYLHSGSLYVYNSIFWGNSGTSPSFSQVALGPGGECEYYRKLFTYYTDIYNTAAGDGCLPGCTGTHGGCVAPRHFDPGFVDPGASPPDLRLESAGAAVNAGSNDISHQAADWLDIDGDGDTSELVPLDLDGNARRTGDMDLGAYERP